MTATPIQVRLRAYQVGFGDCLLLTVTYDEPFADGRSVRHMLVDLGSREKAKSGGPSIGTIAAKVVEHCEGHLDVVVATHRHLDHIKGFGDPTAKPHLDELTPALVVRPWTDVPDDTADDPAFALDADSQSFIALLDGIHR